MNQKRYWLKGLIAGVIFGILVTYVHENVSELGLRGYVNFIQMLYVIGLTPWSFLGILIMIFQFYLPPITYGVLGSLLGWLYGKIKNKNKVIK